MEISTILFGLGTFYFVVLILIAKFRFDKFTDAIINEKPDYLKNLGNLNIGESAKFGNSYLLFTSLFPINEVVADRKINDLIKSHSKIVTIFWMSVVILVLGIIVYVKLK